MIVCCPKCGNIDGMVQPAGCSLGDRMMHCIMCYRDRSNGNPRYYVVDMEGRYHDAIKAPPERQREFHALAILFHSQPKEET